MIPIANEIDPIDFYYSFHEKIAKHLEGESLSKAYEIYTFFNSTHERAISKAGHLAGCIIEIGNAVKAGQIKFKD